MYVHYLDKIDALDIIVNKYMSYIYVTNKKKNRNVFNANCIVFV